MTRTGIVTGYLLLFVVAAVIVVMVCLLMSEPQTVEIPVFAGQVVFEGHPVEGADVYIGWRNESGEAFSVTPELAAKTDRNGAFSFPRETIDKYAVSGIIVSHPDYAVGGINITSVVDPENLKIKLLRGGGTVSGYTYTSDDKPLSGVDILLCQYTINQAETYTFISSVDLPGFVVTSNSDGFYQFDNLPQGAQVSFYAQKTGYFNGNYLTHTETGMTDINFYLEPCGSISGRVTIEETGEPAAGLTVNASSTVMDEFVQTDEDGYYLINNAGARMYHISVIPNERYAGYYASPLESVTVSGIEAIEDVDIVLKKAPVITGTVTDKNTGRPVAGCRINVYHRDPSGEIISWSISDTDGRFRATAIPGEMFVSAMKEGYNNVYTGENDKRRVVTADGTSEEVHLVITPAGTPVTGYVYLPDGSPAAGAIVGDIPPYQNRTFTDNNGRFHIESRMPDRVITLPVELREKRLEGEITIDPSSNEQIEVTLQPYRYASVSGKVTGPLGTPHAEITVGAYLAGGMIGDPVAITQTASDGTFNLDSLRVGKEYFLGARNLQARSIPFYPGPRSGPYTLRLPVADRWLEGRVINEFGKPVSGLTIHSSSETSGYQEGTTDREGRFRIENLASDAVGLFFSGGQYYDLQTNASHEFIVYNNTQRRLGGTIVDQNSNPVPNAHITVDQPGTLRGVVQTDADDEGQFSVNGLRGKTVTMTITCAGYEPLTVESPTGTDEAKFVMSPMRR